MSLLPTDSKFPNVAILEDGRWKLVICGTIHFGTRYERIVRELYAIHQPNQVAVEALVPWSIPYYAREFVAAYELSDKRAVDIDTHYQTAVDDMPIVVRLLWPCFIAMGVVCVMLFGTAWVPENCHHWEWWERYLVNKRLPGGRVRDDAMADNLKQMMRGESDTHEQQTILVVVGIGHVGGLVRRFHRRDITQYRR